MRQSATGLDVVVLLSMLIGVQRTVLVLVGAQKVPLIAVNVAASSRIPVVRLRAHRQPPLLRQAHPPQRRQLLQPLLVMTSRLLRRW